MTALFIVAILGSIAVGIAIVYAASLKGAQLRRNPGKRRLGLGQLLVGLLWLLWGALALSGAGHLPTGSAIFALIVGALWSAQGARRVV
jgi:hypothetical protein